MSAEPSMEDILSSIKRIIAEEGDTSTPRHRRGQGRAAPLPMSRDEEDDEDEVLELSDPISPPTPPPPVQPQSAQAGSGAFSGEPRPAPVARAAPSTSHHPATTTDHGHDGQAAHVSAATVEATRGALGSLSRLLVKPEPDSDGTLEGLVREMLRPMISAWLDRHLPEIVEQLVAREIAKITAGQ